MGINPNVFDAKDNPKGTDSIELAMKLDKNTTGDAPAPANSTTTITTSATTRSAAAAAEVGSAADLDPPPGVSEVKKQESEAPGPMNRATKKASTLTSSSRSSSSLSPQQRRQRSKLGPGGSGQSSRIGKATPALYQGRHRQPPDPARAHSASLQLHWRHQQRNGRAMRDTRNGSTGSNGGGGGGGGGGFHPFHGRVSSALEGGARALDNRLRAPGDTAWLSYHDILLTKEDVGTLRGGADGWLTDNVIAFWEEFLERETLAGVSRQASVVLLRPSMAFLLTQTKDADVLGLEGALPRFRDATHVFCPINDCRNPAQAEGGSHWSLLVVSVVDRTAFHYDSLMSANERDARLLADKLQRLLGFQLRFRDLPESPQQENGSDCGVFVCAAIEHLLCQRLLKSKRGEPVDMSLASVDIDASAMRKKMAKVIEKFRKEGERRRSRSASPYPDKHHRLSSASSRSPPRIGDE